MELSILKQTKDKWRYFRHVYQHAENKYRHVKLNVSLKLVDTLARTTWKNNKSLDMQIDK